MSLREQLRLALRYSFAFGRGYLSTFLSSLSTLGLVLAIALLVAVLSVMNGFDREMRERILALVPHVTIQSVQGMPDWRDLRGELLQHPEVTAASPFVAFDALFLRGSDVQTAAGLGLEAGDSALLAALPGDVAAAMSAREDALVLGAGLARRLQAAVGDSLTLLVPRGGDARGGAGDTGMGRFTLVAVAETGTELDQSLALVRLSQAAALNGLGEGVSGLHLRTRDLFAVSDLAWELVGQLPPGYYATHWMMTHGNLYAAIQLSRDLVSILLYSIIAVAAFNLVSSLVLVVFDKQGDIAILRTLGASGAAIAGVFVLQGALIGAVGVSVGLGLGVALSLALPGLVSGLERLLDYRFLDTDVYPVSFLPVDVLASDLLSIGGIALLMCLLAALYPALRAARLAPAQVLHQERH